MQIDDIQYQQIMEALNDRDRSKCLDARIMLADIKSGHDAADLFFKKAKKSQAAWKEWVNRAVN